MGAMRDRAGSLMRPNLRLSPVRPCPEPLAAWGRRIEGLLNTLVAPRHQEAQARVIDLLWHLPVGVIDRTSTPTITDARVGRAGHPRRHGGRASAGRRSAARRPGALPCAGGGPSGAALELVYFNADRIYLQRLLPVGSRRIISGKLEAYDGWLQMPHPDHVVKLDGAEAARTLPLHEPVYPLTAGLTNTTLRKAIGEALRAACRHCRNGSDAALAAKQSSGQLRRGA